jgi:hypothetical protein
VISFHDQINTAQNYELTSNDRLIAALAFNFDRKESDLTVLTRSELEKLATQPGNSNINVIDAEGKDLSHSISQLNEGKRLWKYCIIATLFFLALEILMIKFFNRKTLIPSK